MILHYYFADVFTQKTSAFSICRSPHEVRAQLLKAEGERRKDKVKDFFLRLFPFVCALTSCGLLHFKNYMKQPETERLILKNYSEENKKNFLNLFTDAAVMKFVDKGVMTVEQAEAFWHKLFEKLYPQNCKIWAIFDKADLRYIGHAGIYPRPMNKAEWEFVYFLLRNEWGKGYATEIARRLIKYAFEELNLRQVFATVDDAHLSSIHVLEKAGMQFERYESDEQGRFSVFRI